MLRVMNILWILHNYTKTDTICTDVVIFIVDFFHYTLLYNRPIDGSFMVVHCVQLTTAPFKLQSRTMSDQKKN